MCDVCSTFQLGYWGGAEGKFWRPLPYSMWEMHPTVINKEFNKSFMCPVCCLLLHMDCGYKDIWRVPTASYKSYNLTRCPIFVLYLGEEGISPIFSLKMSYKSYNLGVLSYNYFQIHVHPAYRQVNAKFFAATRHILILNHNILQSSLSLEVFRCQSFRRYAAIPASSIGHNRLQLSEQKTVFLSVKLVNNVNEYNKSSVYHVLYFVEELSYNPIFFSSKLRGHPVFVTKMFCSNLSWP